MSKSIQPFSSNMNVRSEKNGPFAGTHITLRWTGEVFRITIPQETQIGQDVPMVEFDVDPSMHVITLSDGVTMRIDMDNVHTYIVDIAVPVTSDSTHVSIAKFEHFGTVSIVRGKETKIITLHYADGLGLQFENIPRGILYPVIILLVITARMMMAEEAAAERKDT